MKSIKNGLLSVCAVIVKLIRYIWDRIAEILFIIKTATGIWWRHAKVICHGWTVPDTWKTLKLLFSSIPYSIVHASELARTRYRNQYHARSDMASNGLWINLFDWAEAYLYSLRVNTGET